jgi:hypothetical protein
MPHRTEKAKLSKERTAKKVGHIKGWFTRAAEGMCDGELNKHDNSICPLEIVALIAIARAVVERIGLAVVGPMRKVDARHGRRAECGGNAARAGLFIRWRI